MTGIDGMFFQALSEFMREQKNNTKIYKTIKHVGLVKRYDLYSLMNCNISFPITTYKGMKIVDSDLSLKKMKEIQMEIANNKYEAIINELNLKIEKLSKYLNNNLIMEMYNIIEEVKMHNKIEEVKMHNKIEKVKVNEYNVFDKDLFIKLFNLNERIYNFHHNFNEFFDLIAAGSYAPIADILDPLDYLIKVKLMENNFSDEILNVFYEFMTRDKEPFKFNDENNVEHIVNDINDFYDFCSKYMLKN